MHKMSFLNKAKEFFLSHIPFFCIIVGVLMGGVGFFIDKTNPLSHWSWISQALLIVVYLVLEYARHKQDSLSVEDRFKKYLLDFENWQETEEMHWYYKPDPQFQVCPTKDDIYKIESGEHWVRGALNPSAYVGNMQLKYNSTIIKQVECIYFDEMRGFIPAPNIAGMIGDGEKWFYELCAGDFEFYLLPLLTNRNLDDIMSSGRLSTRGMPVRVAIFKSFKEKEFFLNSLKQQPILAEELAACSSGHFPYGITDRDKEILLYSQAVLNRLKVYRGS